MSSGIAKTPVIDEPSTLQHPTGPITTNDELLRQDKSKVHVFAGPRNLTAACLKDGKILSKFWCDEASDNTDMEHEIDSVIQKIIPQADFYLVSPADKVKTTKRGRPKKQKSPNPPPHHSSPKLSKETVSTRAQAGSKSTLKFNISQ